MRPPALAARKLRTHTRVTGPPPSPFIPSGTLDSRYFWPHAGHILFPGGILTGRCYAHLSGSQADGVVREGQISGSREVREQEITHSALATPQAGAAEHFRSCCKPTAATTLHSTAQAQSIPKPQACYWSQSCVLSPCLLCSFSKCGLHQGYLNFREKRSVACS